MPAKDTQTSHEFDIAGKSASIRFSDWNEKPWLSTMGTVIIGKREFNAGEIGALLADDVESLNDERTLLNYEVGITTPKVELGDVVDSGFGGVGNLVGLIEAIGLDPDHPTHNAEVELSIRTASLTLTRKIGEKPGQRKRKRS